MNKLRCTGKTGSKSILMRTEQSMILKIRQDVIGNKLFQGFHNQRSERNRSIIGDKFFLAFLYTGVTLARFQSHELSFFERHGEQA